MFLEQPKLKKKKLLSGIIDIETQHKPKGKRLRFAGEELRTFVEAFIKSSRKVLSTK